MKKKDNVILNFDIYCTIYLHYLHNKFKFIISMTHNEQIQSLRLM